MKTNFWLHCCGKFFANALMPTVDNQYWPVLIKQQYWPCWPTLTCGQIYKWGLVSYLLCWINFKFAKETLIKISNSLKQCSYPFLIFHVNLLSFILGRIKNNKNRSVSQLLVKFNISIWPEHLVLDNAEIIHLFNVLWWAETRGEYSRRVSSSVLCTANLLWNQSLPLPSSL